MPLQSAYAAFCAAHPTHRATIAGHRWHYIDAGAAEPPLVMLPGGFGEAATSWRYIIALAPLRRVIALHYPPGLASIAGLCDGLAVLLDRLGVERAHLLGGSASGFVAQAFARRHPARVASLILAQSGAPRPARARLSRALAAVTARVPPAVTFAALRFVSAWFLRGPAPRPQDEAQPLRRFWRAHFDMVVAAQSREALVSRFLLAADFDSAYTLNPADPDAWRGPVAIIESSHDGLVGAGERAALCALYPQARVHTIAGGHNDSVLRPEAQIAQLAAIIAAPSTG
jgi:pimeloyl-ACP methyl ester carboxylesterase